MNISKRIEDRDELPPPNWRRLSEAAWALFGALPLMFASGSGAELRQPLGIVMVGGLLVSQVLTLFTTPVIYLFFDRFGRRWASRQPSFVADPGTA